MEIEGEMLSIREYAERHGISYEAVRASVVRYREQLEGHITIQNRKQYIDPEGQLILNECRKLSPVVVIQEESQQRISELEAEISEKQKQIIELQERLLNLKDDYHEVSMKVQKAEFLIGENKRLEDENKQLHIDEVEWNKERDDLKFGLGYADKQIEQAVRARDEAEKSAEESEKRCESLEKALEAAREEQSHYKKTIFGLYKRS